jgi:hypothetical protein
MQKSRIFIGPSTAIIVMLFLQLCVKLARSRSYLGGDAAFKSTADAYHHGLFCGERRRGARASNMFSTCAPQRADRQKSNRTNTLSRRSAEFTMGYLERALHIVSRLSHFV